MDGREANLRQLLEERLNRVGLDHPLSLACVHQLALHLKSKAWRHCSKVSSRLSLEAMQLLEFSWEGRQRVLGPEHPLTLDSLDHLIPLVWNHRSREAAIALCRHAVAVRSQVLGSEHPATLASLQQLAMVLSGAWQLGQPAQHEAESLLWRVLDARERVLGTNHPALYETWDWLENVLVGQGKFAEAVAMRRRAWQQSVTHNGSDHSRTVIMADKVERCLENIRYRQARQQHR